MPGETSFERLGRLLAQDLDPELVSRGLARTPRQRLEWLMEMQAFAELTRKAGRAAPPPP